MVLSKSKWVVRYNMILLELFRLHFCLCTIKFGYLTIDDDHIYRIRWNRISRMDDVWHLAFVDNYNKISVTRHIKGWIVRASVRVIILLPNWCNVNIRFYCHLRRTGQPTLIQSNVMTKFGSIEMYRYTNSLADSDIFIRI